MNWILLLISFDTVLRVSKWNICGRKKPKPVQRIGNTAIFPWMVYLYIQTTLYNAVINNKIMWNTLLESFFDIVGLSNCYANQDESPKWQVSHQHWLESRWCCLI